MRHNQYYVASLKSLLCERRNNTSSCDIANNIDIVALINDICIN